MSLRVITPLVVPPPLSDLSNSAAERATTLQTPSKVQISPKQIDIQTETSAEDINDSVPKIPRVCLDMDVIPDMMAARLATSLLGHVLFLKNQIPFPVAQLSRLPGGKSNTRAAKLKHDLIDSFDTLSSHLDTTFTALSTAFARCSPTGASASGDSNADEQSPGSQAYLAILVGPSIGTAKSKVIFAVDGLETKIWGVRDDLPRKVEAHEEVEDESDSDAEEGLEETYETFDDDDEENSHSEPEDSDSEDDSDVCSTSSRPDSPIPQPPPSPPRRVHPSTSSQTSPTHLLQDHAREQQKIRAADQLLSRTLAMADAEGRGMASELVPTQTHVLLRAPRRFSHPAWIPRPNFANSMEHILNDFLEETRLFVDPSLENKPKSKRTQKQKVEGVWVARRTLSLNTPSASMSGEQENADQGQDEEDEMIWWSWDGKIVGFSSW
ncbi:uncharacterized protein C8R40DRAFT_18202 [Lentinula edodes]|uniref:uncharacterized protein n=1 Tax=Lentinula edodes TaxID=5353 RepID=UPI001E8D5BCE|nr:uncharacterized protein C8R40DRAFT_18202 [Lentinula edodes]KAH7881136.1 hypothetical protein C8R40DRAFT_18202 [Lentinula edodes]